MPPKIAVLYNQPQADRYQAMGEAKAELGVLDEVKAVSQALDELDYEYRLIPLEPPLQSVWKKLESIDADIVINLFEGFDGSPETEGLVAAMLEDLGVPFTGCPSDTMFLALDKSRAKEMMVSAGIPTPKFIALTSDETDGIDLNFPCIVKPASDDASHGISEDSVVYDRESLRKQVSKILSLFGGKVLVEEYIEGREFNTAVTGDETLSVPAVSEIEYALPEGRPRILTFESKWDEDSLYYKNTPAVCPARISEDEKRQISDIAVKAFRLMGCRGYARVDFRQDNRGRFYVLEVNPNPDITLGAGVSKQLTAAGIAYKEFIRGQIKIAMKSKSLSKVS